MAKRTQLSTKRILISKANSSMVIAVSIAAFLTAFSLVASRSLLVRRSYQSKVIAQQEKARDQLKANIDAVDTLEASYQGFVSRNQNLIGGSNTGDGEQDGDNAKIVLDALPSQYDFPALATSLEKILTDRNYSILAISGIDEEATQNASTSTSGQAQVPAGAKPTDDPSSVPTTDVAQTTESGAVEMPFELTAQGNYDSIIDLLGVFQRSIRPIFIQTLTLTAEGEDDSTVQIDVQGKSYFQPEKKLEIKYEVVK
jgi:hypothetical protein